MKVKQIVGEHKKGVRAMKYARKPQNTIAPKKPQKQTIKPGDQVDEAMTATQGKIIANDGKTITVGLPDGTQIQKPIANALGKDPETGAPVFNVATAQTPATMGQAQKDPAQATAAGQQISVNTGEPVEDTQMGESHMDDVASLYDEWMNSEYAPYDDDSGDYNEVTRKAAAFLRGQVPPEKLEDIAMMLSDHFHGENNYDDEGGETDDSYALASAGFGSDEDYGSYDEHQDVGGDATDTFIKSISSPVGGRKSKDDELLEKMRIIAGLR